MSDTINYGTVIPNLIFKIKKLDPNAKIPSRAHEFDAGLDISSIEDVTIEAGAVAVVGTGIAMALPNGLEAQIRSRSGLAARHLVVVLNSPGTIDSSFRGEIKVILMNHGKVPFVINKGDRIAQMVLGTVLFLPNVQIVEDLGDSDRGANGFGSSGLK